MALDDSLGGFTSAIVKKLHSQVHACKYDNKYALAPIHSRIRDEPDPNADSVLEALQNVENHHGQDAYNHITDNNSLQDFADLSSEALIEDVCIFGLRATTVAAYLHHTHLPKQRLLLSYL